MNFKQQCKKWSVQKAIMEQVEKEDIYRWAIEDIEVPEAPEFVPEPKKLGHGFPLQIIRYMLP